MIVECPLTQTSENVLQFCPLWITVVKVFPHSVHGLCAQVCQKAYKAKRSLHCHQITNHPELLDGTPNIASTSDLDPAAASATVSPSTSHLLRETLETRRMARKSGVPDTSTTVPEFVKSLMARSANGHSDEKVSGEWKCRSFGQAPTAWNQFPVCVCHAACVSYFASSFKTFVLG